MSDNAPIPPARRIRPPPLLLLAALLFWGWQSGFLVAGAIMGAALESARLVRARWDLTEADFRRLWNFCALLALVLVVYVFTTNDAGGGLGGLRHPSVVETTHYLSASATSFLGLLPVAFVLLVAAQLYSEGGAIPLSTISWIVRRRRQRSGAPERHVDVAFPYFMVCLFSAGIHPNNGQLSYFWGQAVLLGWALWPMRSRRFGPVVWACALAAAVGLGFYGQRGFNDLQRVLQGYNARWIASLLRRRTDPSQSMTEMGQIGRLKLSSRIVIRLEPQAGSAPPVYLREASYRHYQSDQKTWFSGGTRNDFTGLSHDSGNETSWTLVPGKTNLSTATISSYLEGRSKETGDPEGLLPLPSGSSRLENLPVFTLKTNNAGAALASGLGLVTFDARYGPGATFDSPPDAGTNRMDLTVPANEVPALERVISGLGISGATGPEKLRAIQHFFDTKFSYSVWMGADKMPGTNETALSRFLLQSRSGHCEYFATATVLLLRELGIPARYAVGYAVDERSGRGYVVRERDAHAWCLVWNAAAQTWEDFDTTPASWLAEENKHAPAMQWFSDFWSWVRFQVAKLRWGQAHLRQYILWALVPVLALLLLQIIFRRGRRRGARSNTGPATGAISWPGLDSEFYQLERKLAARGVPRQSSEPLSGWLARALSDPALAGLRDPLLELLRWHYRHRFDPRGLGAPERASLAREAKNCLDRLDTLPRAKGRHARGAAGS
jgi:hypothetical protein